MTAHAIAQTDIAVVPPFERPPASESRRIASTLNLDGMLKWRDIDTALAQFWALVERPPMRSVVIEFSPEVAGRLFELTNVRNRPLAKTIASNLGGHMSDNNFELTGDTIKFSKEGVLLDGQHRLEGARKTKSVLTSHVVFGLEDHIFDVLDQGKRRSPGDILALCGVKDHVTVAGAVRLVLLYTSGGRSHNGGAVTPRQIREYALGSMADITEWTTAGRLINTAFKHPPTMATAILYMISKHNRGLAENFAHEWVHGARVGRNENFDVLSNRLMAIQRTNAGTINRTVRAALIIQTFNHWNAGVIANPRALQWRPVWAFPTLEFDRNAFLRKREQDQLGDTGLVSSMDRVLTAIARNAGENGDVELPLAELALKADVPERQIRYLLDQLEEGAMIRQVRGHGVKGPAIWRVANKGLARLKEIAPE